ncbi:fumarylacetoacetate hydrolase family protein [Variovorax ginsengisoli]|uniref:2-keto-4-pentenoate hydratase/2-oxohepta-3-ene-1,7-dioic acid hydratase in catechol pathway n=1 Tax=Variovorax ginsengisoli TaxID=363844 RepID=A0ABT9S8Y7_9BURK|nr:fumarylacetoacetate hydrolase family protein [Variovorax ginsengisoli]MDP9900823.1 2-keto-4-pentenoate hydratase/2-oxohepta-3-ene-1,7-dioic acid hydratase in catechol pathway [Variovorax ginsengisoli]
MTAYLWNPPATPSLPVRRLSERFPIHRPFFAGQNDHAHAVEMGRSVDKSVEVPFYFTKSASTLHVNEKERQTSGLDKLIWNVPELTADLSKCHHLQPGDLIFTGTPEGVGAVLPGDRIECYIEGVGTIALPIGAAE